MNRLSEIKDFVISGRAKVEEQFDIEYGERIEEIFKEAARLFDIVENALWNANLVLPKHTRNSGIILWKCLKSLLAAVQTCRSGYWSESSQSLRTILESSAVALYLRNKESALAEFKDGQKSLYGKALQETYKIIPSFKGEREMLSEGYIHPGLGSGVVEIKNERYSLVGEFSKADRVKYSLALYHLESTLYLLGRIIEFIFINRLDDPVYWTKFDNGSFQGKPMSIQQMRRLVEFVEEANDAGVDLFKGNEKMIEQFRKIINSSKDK